MFFPSKTNASILSDFTERIKAIFLSSDDQEDVSDTNTTSQTLSILKSDNISDQATDTDTADFSLNGDFLQATSGSLRFSTEDLDIPINDTISVYEIKKGDTIATVAKLFKVSKNTIIWANDLKSQNLVPGDTLVILPMTGIKHTVKSGDTVASIAKKYKADTEDIAKFNGISKDADLKVGDIVLVPEGEITLSPTTVKSKSGKLILSEPLLDIYNFVTPNGFLIRPVVNARKTQGLHGHNGVDFGAVSGTPVIASAEGRVIFAKMGGYNGGYGNMIIINHSDGVQTLYAHLKKVNVVVGETVAQGQKIGEVGNTGRSTGPHLHFEVRGAKNLF